MRRLMVVAKIALASMILAPELSIADIQGNLNFSFNDFTIASRLERDSNYYSIVTATGPKATQIDSVSSPELPVFVYNYAIPQGMQVSGVTVDILDRISMGLMDYTLRPVQFPIDTIQYPFVPPGPAYGDSIFPADNSLGECRIPVSFVCGMGMAAIRIVPLQYIPQTRELLMNASLSFTISFEPSVIRPVKCNHRSETAQKDVDRYLTLLVENKLDVPAYAPPAPGQLPEGVPIEYVIVTDANMEYSFEQLRIWKSEKGFPAEIVVLERDIYPNYPGVDDAEKLRNYIIAAYEEGLRYVLLGGNADVVPIRYASPYNRDTPPEHLLHLMPCDLYYADVDGDWDYDGDGIWGEPTHDQPDIGADVMVSRVLAAGPDSVNMFLDKLMRYEKNPGNGDPSYLTMMVVSASDQPRDYNDFSEFAAELPEYFFVDTWTLFEMDWGEDPDPWSPTGQQIEDFLTNYHPAIYVSEGHGNWEWYPAMTYGYNDGPWDNNLYGQGHPGGNHGSLEEVITGGHDYCHFAIQCILGTIDCAEVVEYPELICPCFAEASIILPGGSVAGTFNTRHGWPTASHRLEVRRFSLFSDEQSDHRLTTSHYGAKLLITQRDLIYDNTYFGDPEMPIWTDIPHSFAVDRPGFVWRSNEQTVTITVTENGSGIAEVLVTLWQNMYVYSRGYTDENGVVELQVYPITQAPLHMVCYKANFYPYEDNIPVMNVCSDYVPGDFDNDGSIFLSDVIALIAYYRTGIPPPNAIECQACADLLGRPMMAYPAADVDGDCDVDMTDINYLMSYIRGSGPPPQYCPNCPPGDSLKSGSKSKDAEPVPKELHEVARGEK